MKPRIAEAMNALSDGVDIVVFKPATEPVDSRPNRSTQVPTLLTQGRAALVGLMHRYLGGLMDPVVSLLEVRKLMYFLQTAGEPLKLRYVKGIYGSYAENLRHVLREVEGHLISGYADGGNAPDKQLTLVPGAVEDTTAFLQVYPATKVRFDRVAQLVEGFETGFGLELLAMGPARAIARGFRRGRSREFSLQLEPTEEAVLSGTDSACGQASGSESLDTGCKHALKNRMC